MGTANLVFGLVLIGKGLVIMFAIGYFWNANYDEYSIWVIAIVFLILCVPFFVVGGLFLRKFDSDRNKAKS